NTYNWKDKVILIVEDEEVNQLFLEAIMQETQVKSIKAFTGEQAIELCKSINKIDLILMDIKLPGIDGITAIKEIKKINPRIPVIVQTAFTDNDNKNKCFQVGSSDYISKPINIELLLSKVNHLLYD
ncbi:MAG: response regulator, partial [bacterium]